jgi:hypothetical protein
MIGGVLQKDPFVTRQFKAGLKKMFPKSRPLIPEIEPVIGAIRLGQERL